MDNEKELTEEVVVAEEVVVTEEELLKLSETLGESPYATAQLEAENVDENLVNELSESKRNDIKASMEAILFMSDRPIGLPKLRSTIDTEVPLSIYRELMTELRTEFEKEFRGVEIAEVSMGFQLRTKAHMASVLRKLIKTQPLKLSPPTMETLAVIAYKQPVTKDEIDRIRSVDSGYMLRNLMEKHLVRIAGRSELPGKPILYGTTHEFLELFSLRDAKALPALYEVEAMVAASEIGEEVQEKEQLEEFSKIVLGQTKILFDDSGIDEELESLRSEIAAIPTSTDFIDAQKEREKLAALGVAETADIPHIPTMPSDELVKEAEKAQWERHSSMINEALDESNKALKETELSVSGAGATNRSNEFDVN